MIIRFRELLGQEKAKEMLRRMLIRDRPAHAYLFRGPAGVGKKSAAHALAATLNCLKPDDYEACGVCPSCRKFLAGNHPDFILIEPDGAAIKISQVRELKKTLAFPPYEGRFRVVLLTEIHTMRREAANSLLKTLEEPPAGTILILTGDEAGDILPTILSRCQIIPFYPLPRQALAAHLAQELTAEVSDHRAPHLAAIGPAHVLAYASPSRLPQPAAPCARLPHGPRDHLPADNASEELAATLAAVAEGSLGRARALQERGLLQKRRAIAESLLTLAPEQPEAVEKIFALAEEAAALKEELPELLDLLRSWFHDLAVTAAAPARPPINLDLLDLLPAARRRWPPVRLAELPRRCRQAKAQLGRNCNRSLVCEVLFFDLL